jgi:hypothetical protein
MRKRSVPRIGSIRQQIRVKEDSNGCVVDLIGTRLHSLADTREGALQVARMMMLIINPTIAEVEFEVLESEGAGDKPAQEISLEI